MYHLPDTTVTQIGSQYWPSLSVIR